MKKLKNICKEVYKELLKKLLVSDFLAGFIYNYVKFAGNTIRWQKPKEEDGSSQWNNDESIIVVGWHGRILMLPHFWNGTKKISALVSLHRDGRLIAALLRKFGIGVVDGSTNINPQLAAINLMRALHAQESIAIIPDGPRGPRMKMTMSPFYFAHKTGKPIFGVTYSAKKAIIMERAWDKMMLPLPFSEGVFLVTKPFYVPMSAAPEELDTYRLKFEQEINQLTYEADIAMGRTPVEPGVVKKRIRRGS